MALLNSECLGVSKHSSNDFTTVPERVKFELRIESDLSTLTHRRSSDPIICTLLLSLVLSSEESSH